jgi:hypothetical protein
MVPAGVRFVSMCWLGRSAVFFIRVSRKQAMGYDLFEFKGEAALRKNLVTVVAVGSFVIAGQGSLFGSDESPGKTGQAEAKALEFPRIQLAPRPHAADDRAFRLSVAAKAAELVGQSENAADPIARAGFLLSAANHLLAGELEPGSSRLLLELEPDPAAGAAGEVFDRIDGLLSRVGAALDEVSGPRGEDERLAAAASRLDTLLAFSQALRVVLDEDRSMEAARRARRAASDLSVLLEASHPGVVAAATLWQAVLRSREEDVSVALGILDAPLSDPPRQALSHAFFSRLLRTRLLARQGSFAASVALLSQMEDRCEFWFVNERDREDAIRTVNWFRMLTLRDWVGKFTGDAGRAGAEWCEVKIRALREEHFKEDSVTVFRLGAVIPLLSDAPGGERSPENRE